MAEAQRASHTNTSEKLKLSCFSRVRLFVTPWTITHQAPLSIEILQARGLEWVACPPPSDLPNQGFKPTSPVLQADSLPWSHLRSSPVLMQGLSILLNLENLPSHTTTLCPYLLPLFFFSITSVSPLNFRIKLWPQNKSL